MTTSFIRGMARATALTRSGDLAAATVLIQTLLSPQPGPATPAEATVIDGQFTRLPDAPTPPDAPHRTSLRQTLQALRKTPPNSRATAPATAHPLPTGAAFTTHAFSNANGQRDYKLYLPANTAQSPMPLVVMLHGCTQNPDDFAAGTGMNTLAERDGFTVAYPAQTHTANANACWNWFRSQDQRRNHGEPAIIAGIVAQIMRDHPIDPARIYIAGLSAGGATAAIVGSSYPDIFAAVGVHSGLPIGAAKDVPQAFAAMRSGTKGSTLAQGVPAIVFHGTADTTVNPQNGDAVAAQLRHGFGPMKTDRQQGVIQGGRSYHQTRYRHSDGRCLAEHWVINGAGHAWSGGQSSGSYTDPAGPDASAEMLRFFWQNPKS